MIRCRIHRWWLARQLDDGSTVPSRVRRHLEKCPDCRTHFERERHCAGLLSAQAAEVRVPAPPFLRQRVLANLESWEDRRPAAPRAGWWALTASAAALVATFWLIAVTRSDSGFGTRRATIPADEVTLEYLSSSAAVLEFGAQLDSPLESEWESVMLDARNALDALSRSFVVGELEAER